MHQLILLSEPCLFVTLFTRNVRDLIVELLVLQGVRREVGNHARALNKVLPKSSINSIASKDKDGFIDSQRGTSSTLNMAYPDPRSSTNSRKSPQLVTTDQRVKQTTRLAANYDESPLKESIGHTEVEVVAGALLGFVVSLAVNAVM